MADPIVSDQTFKMVERALDIIARRQSLINSNVTNIDTPGYKPKDLDFKKTLKAEIENTQPAMARTHVKHFSSSTPLETSDQLRPKGEKGAEYVDVDVEMTHLMQNNLQFRTNVEMLIRKMGILQHAIREGGR